MSCNRDARRCQDAADAAGAPAAVAQATWAQGRTGPGQCPRCGAFLRGNGDCARCRLLAAVQSVQEQGGDGNEEQAVDAYAALTAALGRPPRAEERRYLTGPFVFHGRGPGGWTDVPDWVNRRIRASRMEAIVRGDEASDLDLVVYLSSASLTFPLDREHTDIFVYVASRAMVEWGKVPRPMPDLMEESLKRGLSAWEKDLLRELSLKLRRAVVKHAKKGKGEKT